LNNLAQIWHDTKNIEHIQSDRSPIVAATFPTFDDLIEQQERDDSWYSL
jgi:hypothetical protein